MPKDITTLLKQATKDLLSEDSLKLIKESFDSAVSIHVEKALAEQDNDYAKKLEHLLEVQDTDHTNKLKKVVEAVDLNNAKKLQTVVARYSKALTEQASTFRDSLVTKLSNYLDVYLEEKIPTVDLNEAVKAKKAKIVLENLRRSLAIDSALMASSIEDAVLDGARQLHDSNKEASELQDQVISLTEQLEQVNAKLVLESKLSTLNDEKRSYARRILDGKSVQFINENFEYTMSLFDQKEEERIEALREEAFENTVIRESVSVPASESDEVLEESTQTTKISTPFLPAYLSELGKY
jgi:hypothetical protein